MAGSKEGYQERGFDQQVAWWAKWGGLGVAVLGAVTGVNSLVVPGLLAAVGGFIYEGAKESNKK